MNETINLHLPQFEVTDRIHHDDFNAAFAAIDTAVAAGVKITCGSYTGNGGTGNSGMHLTFPFRPRLIAISNNAYPRYFAVNVLPDDDASISNRYITVLSVSANNSSQTAYGKNTYYKLEGNTFFINDSEAKR